MAQLLKENGYVKEANLILKIRKHVLYGEIVVQTHAGRVARVRKEVIYDDLSEGL